MDSQQLPPQQESLTNEKDQQAPPYQTPPPEDQYQNPPAQGQYQGAPQGQYNAPPPGQEQYPPQGHYAPQQPPQANINQGKGNYATAMPISSLQSGPSPVDCPVCGVREVTAVEYHSGMVTQYV